jgi:hypothetical protein
MSTQLPENTMVCSAYQQLFEASVSANKKAHSGPGPRLVKGFAISQRKKKFGLDRQRLVHNLVHNEITNHCTQ